MGFRGRRIDTIERNLNHPAHGVIQTICYLGYAKCCGFNSTRTLLSVAHLENTARIAFIPVKRGRGIVGLLQIRIKALRRHHNAAFENQAGTYWYRNERRVFVACWNINAGGQYHCQKTNKKFSIHIHNPILMGKAIVSLTGDCSTGSRRRSFSVEGHRIQDLIHAIIYNGNLIFFQGFRMEYKYLGRTGVKVSALCFGAMSFGGDADKAESARMYTACRDRGINFFDCADGYSKGRAEQILGALIKGERDQLVITSKCFNPMSDDVNARGANRRHILKAVEASLKRLGTDRLDVLFMHRWDPLTPLQETLRALQDLVSAGKVNYLGASNYAAWQIAKGLGISENHGWPRFDIIQPMYSLVKRQAEAEILPLAHAEQLAVISYSPVGGGLLSGKYGPAKRPADGRLVSNPEYVSRYSEKWMMQTAVRFTEYANSRGVHPVSLAVAWVAAHPDICCPIIGARNLQQLQASLDAMNIQYSAEMHEEISALSPRPAPATDRLEEQLG